MRLFLRSITVTRHHGFRATSGDTVMNYDAFMEPVTWFLTGLEKHSDEYRDDLLGNHISFPRCNEPPYVQISL